MLFAISRRAAVFGRAQLRALKLSTDWTRAMREKRFSEFLYFQVFAVVMQIYDGITFLFQKGVSKNSWFLFPMNGEGKLQI